MESNTVKKLLLALALLLVPSAAFAQCNGVFPNNTVCGNVTGSGNLPRPTSPSAFSNTAGGTNGQIQFNNSGTLGGLTDTQVTTHINPFSSTLPGAAPLSGGGTANFLRADGTWAPVATSVFGRTGTVISVAGDYISSQINTTAGFTGATVRTQLAKNNDTINAADFGVVCDGSTVNTTAWATAISAVPSTGATINVPRGVCIGTVVLNKANIIFRGQGWSSTGATGTCGSEIRSTGTADNVITISSTGVQVEDLCVTNSVAAGSRTGAGIKITSGPNILISRVFSTSHKYGFWVQGAGNELEHVFAAFNATYGLFFDGSTGNHTIDENAVYNSQFNSTGSTAGVGIVAGGFTHTGFFFSRLTAVGNAGAGFLLSGAINDVHIVMPELSSNTVHQLDAINGSGGNLTVVGGLIEVVTGGGIAVDIGTAQQFVVLTGNVITATGNAMILAGSHATVTGNLISGAGANNTIAVGAVATKFVIGNNNIAGNGAGGSVGISIAAGATGCMIGANTFTTVATQITDGTAGCTYASVTGTKPTYP